MKSVILCFAWCLFVTIGWCQPPSPDTGYRWVLQEEYSDEFNGDKLDLEKWHDHHPRWLGRPPAMFQKEMVSVNGGMLNLKNQKLEKDSVVPHKWNNKSTTFSIAGGAIVSRKQEAFYGYYECRMKANKTLMSSTFWMSKGSWDGPKGCGDKYSLELDIQECVGRECKASKTFDKGMHSNTHYWYSDCDKKKGSLAKGNNFKDTVSCADNFNVYAAHWVDAQKVRYYYNNNEGATVLFRTDITDKPFDQPMHINMVTETYTWIGPPTDEELADDTKNTSYYDWIRAYKVIPVDSVIQVKEAVPVFTEELSLVGGACELDASGKVNVLLNYKLNNNGWVKAELIDGTKTIASEKVMLLAGYGQREVNLDFKKTKGTKVKLTLFSELKKTQPIGVISFTVGK